MTPAFPLQWPEGWPRHKGDREYDGRFRGSRLYSLTVASAAGRLLEELRLLGAKVDDVIVSTNLKTRLDGIPYSNQPLLGRDPGVAVYFEIKNRKLVMAQDRYQSVEGNLTSLALAVSGMRQIERHGGGSMMERAFTGFVAIAPPNWKKPWRQVFGVKPEWTGDINALYRQKAKQHHPDQGGSHTLMAELNVAYEEAKLELSKTE